MRIVERMRDCRLSARIRSRDASGLFGELAPPPAAIATSRCEPSRWSTPSTWRFACAGRFARPGSRRRGGGHAVHRNPYRLSAPDAGFERRVDDAVLRFAPPADVAAARGSASSTVRGSGAPIAVFPVLRDVLDASAAQAIESARHEMMRMLEHAPAAKSSPLSDRASTIAKATH